MKKITNKCNGMCEVAREDNKPGEIVYRYYCPKCGERFNEWKKSAAFVKAKDLLNIMEKQRISEPTPMTEPSGEQRESVSAETKEIAYMLKVIAGIVFSAVLFAAALSIAYKLIIKHYGL